MYYCLFMNELAKVFSWQITENNDINIAHIIHYLFFWEETCCYVWYTDRVLLSADWSLVKARRKWERQLLLIPGLIMFWIESFNDFPFITLAWWQVGSASQVSLTAVMGLCDQGCYWRVWRTLLCLSLTFQRRLERVILCSVLCT